MGKNREFRVSSLNERIQFYKEEFDISKIKKWFHKNKMKLLQLCAIDAGTETGIILDKKNRKHMLYFPFDKLKEKIRKYVPEDVYYDRNIYSNSKRILNGLKFDNFIEQELVFDIDSENLDFRCPKK